MRKEPTQKWALVTGAGIRVGRAIALSLAEAGFDCILHGNRSRVGISGVAEEIEGMGRHANVFLADLSLDEEVDRLAREISESVERLDLIVHNAGIYEHLPFATIGRQAYRRMQAINLEAPFFLSQLLLPLLEKGEDPSIVHIGDVGGERPEPGYAHYAVSKAGLLMLTRALAVELAPRVRVNAVSPGTVAFPEDFSQEERRAILERIPQGREGAPSDIAEAVVFLATKAPYVTGQVINVDGGRSVLL